MFAYRLCASLAQVNEQWPSYVIDAGARRYSLTLLGHCSDLIGLDLNARLFEGVLLTLVPAAAASSYRPSASRFDTETVRVVRSTLKQSNESIGPLVRTDQIRTLISRQARPESSKELF